MSSSTINFFKCLICNSNFGDLLKAQKHIDKHDHDKKNKNGDGPCQNTGTGIDGAAALVRRRGMLPIKMMALSECFIPVEKVKVSIPSTLRPRGTFQEQMLPDEGQQDIDEDIESQKSDCTPDIDDEYLPPVKKKHKRRKKETKEVTDKCKKIPRYTICPVPTCNSTYPSNYSAMSDHFRRHLQAERMELVRNSDLTKDKSISFPRICPKNANFFQCKFCLTTERSSHALTNHVDQAHPHQPKLQCPHCDQEGFEASVTSFICHMKTCHPDQLDLLEKRRKPKRFQCSQCPYACFTPSVLNKHIEGNHRHVKSKENSNKPNFSCPVCERVCSSRENLLRHFHLHLENNPFTCDFPNCNKKFNSHYNLRRHKLLHDEEHLKASQQKCPICGANYARKETLEKHVRVFHDKGKLKAGNFHLPRMRKQNFRTVAEDNSPTLYPPTPLSRDNNSRNWGQMPVLTPMSNPTVETPENWDSIPVVEAQVKFEPGFEPNMNRQIKVEDNQEEIHLVDKIIIEEDGTAVHIKGERLSPQKAPPGKNGKVPEPTTIAVDVENVTAKMLKGPAKFSSPFDAIAGDPVFQKIAKKDPSAVQNFFSSGHLNRSRGKIFSCNECHGVFDRAWSLQLHMRTQHKKTLVGEFLTSNSKSIMLMCALCTYPSKSKNDLAKHMKKSHKNTVRTFKCKMKGCNQDFDSLRKLTSHQTEIHSCIRKFPCNYCGNAFMSEVLRKRHEDRVHRTRKDCPICHVSIAPKSFPEHMKKHRDEEAGVEKPRCRICQDSFSCRMALQRHIDGVHLGKISYAKGTKKKVTTGRKRKMD